MPDLCLCKDGSLIVTEKEEVAKNRTKAYGIALRVLAKKRPEEFKAIYARVLEEEYGLKAGHTNDVIGKYV
jgi:hypothetical protein